MKRIIISKDFHTEIKTILEEARNKAFKSINFLMVEAGKTSFQC